MYIYIYIYIYIYMYIRQHFVKNWKRLPDDCEILLNTCLTKPDDLLIILNSVNNDIQFSMEINDNSSLF